jgi:hypothetical protein
MAALVEVIRPTEDGVWRVAVDGRCIVAFYGEGGQQLAEYHRDALEELLAAQQEEARLGVPPVAEAALPADPIGIWASSIFPTTIN